MRASIEVKIKRANALLATPDKKGHTALMWAVSAASAVASSSADGGEGASAPRRKVRDVFNDALSGEKVEPVRNPYHQCE